MTGTVLCYSSNLPIRNMEQLPMNRGARYLEVMPGDYGDLIAVRWRRKPICGPTNQLIDFEPHNAAMGGRRLSLPERR